MNFREKTGSASALHRRDMIKRVGAGVAAGGLALGMSGTSRATTKRDDSVVDVAVIGAGLSGLTAARDLARAGCDSFVVLEARDRVGGRTVNHDIGDGVVSEGGGQWIGPGQTAIAELARELGIGTFDSYYAGATVYLAGDQRVVQELGNGGLGAGNATVDALNELSLMIPVAAPWSAHDAAALDRMSLADWLATRDLSDDDRLTFYLSAILTYGAPPEKLSLLHYLTIIASFGSDLGKLESMKGGAQEKRLVGGSFILSEKMAEELGNKVRLSSPVRRISGWGQDVVELKTDTCDVLARQVIFAMSPSLAGHIDFEPALPPQRKAMHDAWPTTAHMRKTVHVYSRPFWRDAGLNGQVVDIGGPVLWSADNSPPDGSVGIITAFIAEDSLPPDPNAAGPAISGIYARALGDEALHPLQYHEIDWGSEEWSLSCTSPYQPGFLSRFGQIMHEPVGRIVWSGTDMDTITPSSMDGAIRSGHRAALTTLHALADGQQA